MVILSKLSKFISKDSLVALFFITLSTLLILSWFREGYFYAGGDVGLPTFNPKRIFEMSKYLWWEAIAPGFLIPHVITSITLYFFLSILQISGLGPVGIQAILFFVLLFLMGFGMYLLTLSVIGQDRKALALIAGLFYIFNPYMMTQIWHRFTHTSFFFVSSIPFIILFWKNWIKTGSLLNLLIFLLINFLASYMFGTIAFVFPLWLILFLFTISEIFLPWENKSHFIKIFWRSILGLTLWVVFNSWWLIPVLTVSQGIASQQHNIWASIDTLIITSKQAILPYALQMGNSYYLFDQAELGEIYKSLFFRFIPWLGVIIIFFGLIYSLKIKHLASLVLIYLIIVLLAKGTSLPFGQPFLLLFSKFFAFGLLRNPFEKIGILLPVVSSILFVIGIEGLKNFFKNRISTANWKIFLMILFAIMGIYYWPMYQGTIFGSVSKKNYVEMPQAYSDANKWLNQEIGKGAETSGKILHLPLSRSDIVTYKWKYGYHGVESSAAIFTALPSISHGVNLHRVDDSLSALSLVFHRPFNLHHEKILKLLQDFNVKFIILHKDIEWLGKDLYNPQDTEELLNNLSFITRKAEFGGLIIYGLKEEFFKPKIEIADNILLVSPQKADIRLWPWLVSQNDKSFLTPNGEELSNDLKSAVREAIIFPDNSFVYPEASTSSFEQTKQQLTSQLKNLVAAVQFAKELSTIQIETEETIQKTVLASQKLIEVYETSKGIDEYLNLISSIFPLFDDKSALYFDVAKTTVVDLLKLNVELLKLHEVILSELDDKLNSTDQTKVLELNNKIRQFLKKEKTLPSFPYKSNITEVEQRRFFDFQLDYDGSYELLLPDPGIEDAYDERMEKVDFEINGEPVTLQGEKLNNVVSFGNIDLKKGLNELSFTNLGYINLLISLDKLIRTGQVGISDNTVEMLVSRNNPAAIEIPIPLTSGEDVFQISFNGEIPQNVGLYIQVLQDTDNEQNNQKIPRISFLQHLSQINWQGNYKVKLPPLSISTRQAGIRLIVLIPSGVPNLNEISKVVIEDLRVIRVLSDTPFLKIGEKESDMQDKAQLVSFKRKSPVEYEGNLKITHPSFVIFKETYHPGWKLFLIKDGKRVEQKDHYLANLYGNIWWINETGEFKFKIEFEPQKKVTIGIYLAIFGGIILLILAGIRKYERNH